MKEKHIERRSKDELRGDKTDWKRVAALADAEIEAAIAEDPEAAPPVGKDWFKTARLVMPGDQGKVAVSLRLDQDVVEWFKCSGRGYQTRMNAVLRAFMLEHRR